MADPRHHAVPLIDVAPLLTGGRAERLTVARAIGRACEDIGFFTIVGHGVDPGLIDRMDRVSRAFFDLPVADKQKVARPKPEQSRGYIGVGEENLAYGVGTATPIGRMYGVNLGCLEGITEEELSRLPITFVDGMHDRWQSAPEYTAHL